MLRRIVLFLAFLPSALFARSYGDFELAPAPQWIDRAAPELTAPVRPDLARYGVFDILSDHQVRVARDGATTHYFRTVRKVLSPSGVQNASELTVDFDPTFQRLVIHEVVVLRDGRTIKALDPAEVRVIEKEDDSESGIYDGRLTALLFLKDVRAGDVIDYSWSIDGANPILRGRYADEYDLGASVPARLIRHRLVWAAPRPLRFRATKGSYDPAVEQEADAVVYTWQARDVAAAVVEDRVPSWFEAWPVVEVTDFESWAEVARWSAEMFDPDAASIEAVEALAGKIRSEHPADPVTAAIRFVQDDIRYLGIEIGRNSHEPRQPAEVLAQRWGDCKEKALLLSMLLREFGLQADAALVNTRAKAALVRRFPSPFAFDHVVVRVVKAGRTFWVDPTISQQGGTLETIDTPNDGRALLVRHDANDLVVINTRRRASMLIDETYEATARDAATELTVRSTYTGADADSLRADLEAMSSADLARDRINHYASDHPSIRPLAAPRVSDDRLRNVIVVTEKYSIPNLFRRGEWTHYPRALENALEKPESIIRSMPLAIDYPLDVTEKATFRFPASVEPTNERFDKTTAAIVFTSSAISHGRDLVLQYSLRARADSVSAADVPRHLTAINEISDELGYAVKAPPVRVARTEMGMIGRAHPGLVWTGAAVLLLTLVGVAAVALRIVRSSDTATDSADGR